MEAEVRSSRIHSVLARFEATIEQNKVTGGHDSKLYLTVLASSPLKRNYQRRISMPSLSHHAPTLGDCQVHSTSFDDDRTEVAENRHRGGWQNYSPIKSVCAVNSLCANEGNCPTLCKAGAALGSNQAECRSAARRSRRCSLPTISSGSLEDQLYSTGSYQQLSNVTTTNVYANTHERSACRNADQLDNTDATHFHTSAKQSAESPINDFPNINLDPKALESRFETPAAGRGPVDSMASCDARSQEVLACSPSVVDNRSNQPLNMFPVSPSPRSPVKRLPVLRQSVFQGLGELTQGAHAVRDHQHGSSSHHDASVATSDLKKVVVTTSFDAACTLSTSVVAPPHNGTLRGSQPSSSPTDQDSIMSPPRRCVRLHAPPVPREGRNASLPRRRLQTPDRGRNLSLSSTINYKRLKSRFGAGELQLKKMEIVSRSKFRRRNGLTTEPRPTSPVRQRQRRRSSLPLNESRLRSFQNGSTQKSNSNHEWRPKSVGRVPQRHGIAGGLANTENYNKGRTVSNAIATPVPAIETKEHTKITPDITPTATAARRGVLRSASPHRRSLSPEPKARRVTFSPSTKQSSRRFSSMPKLRQSNDSSKDKAPTMPRRGSMTSVDAIPRPPPIMVELEQRKRIKKLTRASLKIQSWLHGRLARGHYIRQRNAAVRIQAFVRGIRQYMRYRVSRLQTQLELLNRQHCRELKDIQLELSKQKMAYRKKARERDHRRALKAVNIHKLTSYLQRENDKIAEQNKQIAGLVDSLNEMNEKTQGATEIHSANFATMWKAIEIFNKRTEKLTGKGLRYKKRLDKQMANMVATRARISQETRMRKLLEQTLLRVVDTIELRCADDMLVAKILRMADGDYDESETSVEEAHGGEVHDANQEEDGSVCILDAVTVDNEEAVGAVKARKHEEGFMLSFCIRDDTSIYSDVSSIEDISRHDNGTVWTDESTQLQSVTPRRGVRATYHDSHGAVVANNSHYDDDDDDADDAVAEDDGTLIEEIVDEETLVDEESYVSEEVVDDDNDGGGDEEEEEDDDQSSVWMEQSVLM